nr:MFS transporter [Nocardioides flavescens]
MVSAAVPPFLVAVLAVQIDRDIGFSTVQLGGGVAAYFFVSALGSPWAGRLVATYGAARPLRIATLACTVGLLAVAAAPAGWAVVAALALLGIANAAAQPAATHVITGIELPRTRATAFGLVQSSIPATTLLAGVVLAAFQDQSWRLAVVLVAALTLAAQLPLRWVKDPEAPPVAAQVEPPTRRGGIEQDRARGFVALMAATGFFVSLASTCLPSFLVVTGLLYGLSPSLVAGVQVAGSLTSILVRVVAASTGASMSGAGNVAGVVLLASAGALGFGLISTGSAAAFVAGSLLAYGCGWGWSGLFNLSVTRAVPHTAAASTGVTQGGIFLGGSIGPLAFAGVVHGSGTQLAWGLAAVSACVASACALAARHRWTRPVVVHHRLGEEPT